MAIQFRCRECEEVLKAPDTAAGKVMTCKECGTKNKVPAKKGTKKKKRKAPPRRPAGGGDFLSGDLAKEDARYTICQKCGEQFTGEDSTCPYCGYDVETGGYTKEAKRSQLKAQGLVDPTEFFEIAKGESASFLFSHTSLALRSALYTFIPAVLCLVMSFLVIFNSKTPPKVFFGFVACVFGLGAIGWMMALCGKLVRAKLEGDEKLDRIEYDFFECAAEGVTFLSLQIAWLIPAVMAIVGAIMIGQEQPEVGIPLMVAGPVLLLPFYPVILAHLAMPVNWPAWLFTKGLAIWGKLVSPSFYWVGFTLLAMLPGLAGLGIAGGVFAGEIEEFVDTCNSNAEIAYEQYLFDRGEGDEPTEEQVDLDFEPIIPPVIISLLSIFYIGFAWVYPARMLAWYALYFRRPLGLIQEKKERTYHARERKMDEDGNVIVVRSGPPMVVFKLGGTILFYVVANVVVYFASGGEYILLPRPLALALGLFAEGAD